MASKQPYPWPKGKKACIALTMDNLGEAADLHRKIWPKEQPLGNHYSVHQTLPKMLQILSSNNISVTYFIEAWNCGTYPETIEKVQAAGHEVGFHAYQHEVWSLLDAETEVGNLDKSVDLAAGVGVAYKGFRPPGGLVTDRTLGLMKQRRMKYLSPAASRLAVVEGVAMVPFQWESIDAYFYMESTAPLRKGKGDSEEVLSAGVLKERLMERVRKTVDEGGYLSLLFHPFLQTSDERMGVMREIVEYIKKVEQEEGVWVAKCEEVAEWVLKHEEAFGNDPGWDRAEWKKN